MILDEFTGRNCKRTEYIDASGKHWVVRTDPVFVERRLTGYETTLLLHLEHCNAPHRRATSATIPEKPLKLEKAGTWQMRKAGLPQRLRPDEIEQLKIAKGETDATHS